MRGLGDATEWAIVAAITIAAAVLRLWQIGKVPPDPFYDAAVRSMTLSWHNFFFGAFEPGGERLDRQAARRPVAAGREREAARLQLDHAEAARGAGRDRLGAAAVRGRAAAVEPAAGIAAAAALACCPIEVITSRSDTMDAVMMALLVLALLLIVRALETGPHRLAAGGRGRARAWPST